MRMGCFSIYYVAQNGTPCHDTFRCIAWPKIMQATGMLYASRSSNVIVKQCINHAMYDSNSGVGYKFAFYGYAYNIDVFCTMKLLMN